MSTLKGFKKPVYKVKLGPVAVVSDTINYDD